MPSINPDGAVRLALSPSRIGTYELASTTVPRLQGALALYAWNAKVSAALMAPMHLCEVVIRNAASDALTHQYGPQWPWSHGLEQSLPDPPTAYSLKKDLLAARRGRHTVGKVIPELKFMFWEMLFTQRFDQRLWSPYLQVVFPHAPLTQTYKQHRLRIYNDLDQLRLLRNRMAHHEPIFKRNLADDLKKMQDLMALRCPETAQWMMGQQQASALIAAGP